MSGGRRKVRATFWLLDAPDSISEQSHRAPDGTGLGVFDHRGQSHVHRLPIPAYEDAGFARQARHVSSRTFIAHVRYASGSGISLENTHPFEQRGRLFGHNGVLRGLDELEAELGPSMDLVHGDTDSERYFALITREVERLGDVRRGIVSATEWIAERLPVYALNFVLVTADELWALRYPESHRLYVLERAAGGRHRRHFEGTSLSGLIRIRSPDLLHHPAVVVASEPLDDNPDWRLLEPGELVRVRRDLGVESHLALPGAPAHPLTREDLLPKEAASQSG
jgi:predicted glutamine amidotransferase